MTDAHAQRTLLDELDARQDEVLDQLDELNLRIESVLKDWSFTQRSDRPVSPS